MDDFKFLPTFFHHLHDWARCDSLAPMAADHVSSAGKAT